MRTKPGKRYIDELRRRYQKSSKAEKKIILDEFIKTTSYHRKSAIRILRNKYRYTTKPIKRPRRRKYELLDAIVLAKICKLFDWINSKRIQPQIGIAFDSLAAAGLLTNLPTLRKRLVQISPATIDRLLKEYKRRPVGKGRSYTKPGTLLKNKIPVRTFADWNENIVGFFEIDLVGHEGGNAQGEFAFTLDFVEVKVAWTEQIAVVNKAQKHVFAGIQTIRGRLPFPLLGYDSDSGSEFINWHLYRYSVQEKITFTRGRSGKKNDNAFVEEKNNSIVRRWVGYGRYDTPEQVDILNEFYEVLRLYNNFFVPVMKLKEKIRVGSRTIKRYDKPATPYQRVLQAKEGPQKVKQSLRKEYKTLNLVDLKKRIDEILKRLKPTRVR